MKRIALFSFCVLSVTAALLLAQDSVTGTWVIHASDPDGTTQDTYLQLEQNGSSLGGNVYRNYRPAKITDGSFSNGHVHFSVRAGRNRTATYDGTLDGNRLHLKFAVTGGNTNPAPTQLTAERTSNDAMRPPAPLPLPSLHEVPDNGLARTPPMGWNSWNHFAHHVDDATIRGIADAMVSSGMKKAGYIYVNIDDTWEGGRDAQGNITTNRKFPDMKALADYVHSKGLKIGIYSSPGPKTCAGYEGSFGHELQDAKTYAAWGIDYLKYDWCSAGAIYPDSAMRAVYQKMGDALQSSGRPIIFSLCQYGRENVWTWGAKVGGNSWRTTGDISDNWKSMESIGFRQAAIAPYIKPGHWNDPDMLEIGNGGMNQDEYRTHMSLWCLLAAPLLAGNDLRNMSPETLAILTNAGVIAIDQDRAAHPVKRTVLGENTEVWTRPLADDSVAVGLFNRDDREKEIKITWPDLGLNGRLKGQDLWKHKKVKLSGSTFSAQVPAHGVVLLRVKKS